MANTVVMKFGGTSVGSTDRIGEVAKKVAAHIKRTGDKVAVVVSAMSGETDRLLEFCRKVGADNERASIPEIAREMDQAAATGEQVTCALTAIALRRLGVAAQSFTAPQLGISTREVYGQHLIEKIDGAYLRKVLAEGIIPIVAGFQGVDLEGSLRTLGRGGSDNTAVALAAELDSCRCYIYTDIDGVYTALPSICKQAKKLKQLSYEEMLELASSGAKVLQARSVALAKKFNVPLIVCSSFQDVEGTEIIKEYEGMEDAVVSGITCRSDEAKLTLRDLPDRPSMAAKVFQVLGEAGVNVDMIVQSQGQAGKATLCFTVPSDRATVAYDQLVKLIQAEVPSASLEIDKNMAKLSVVGEGMRTHTGVAAKMFEVLGKEGINVDMVTTSEIKITIAIHQRYAELAVRALHEHFIEKR